MAITLNLSRPFNFYFQSLGQTVQYNKGKVNSRDWVVSKEVVKILGQLSAILILRQLQDGSIPIRRRKIVQENQVNWKE